MYGQTQADHVLPGLLQAKSGGASSWDESIESIVCASTPVSPSKLGRWALQDKQCGLALGGWDPPSLVMTPAGRRAAGEMFVENGTFLPPPHNSLLLGSFSSRDRSKRRTLDMGQMWWREREEARIQTAVERSLGYVTSLKVWQRRPFLVRLEGRFSDFLCNFFSLLFCLLPASCFSPPSFEDENLVLLLVQLLRLLVEVILIPRGRIKEPSTYLCPSLLLVWSVWSFCLLEVAQLLPGRTSYYSSSHIAHPTPLLHIPPPPSHNHSLYLFFSPSDFLFPFRPPFPEQTFQPFGGRSLRLVVPFVIEHPRLRLVLSTTHLLVFGIDLGRVTLFGIRIRWAKCIWEKQNPLA
ncbi:uncharacterized protein CLUP02_11660 [Colletotrichum lupini]|uniref:Uncharacterized protein n=1 Tax=Colletotrichum lupini TaxID=145971 RepID=A0A9Q8SZC8_9PEZI|nr:uncharacterized protein CLUP02_11660 [Colletotrichum lupini]UQC86160.1 hypothetical protein CLUP02_11660 [Colletotrichum lupini]